jgi:hypothetical protein
MTCGDMRLDKTITSFFARRQGVQSTSSGEAGMARRPCRIFKHFLEWLGYGVLYQLHLDSSAVQRRRWSNAVALVRSSTCHVTWMCVHSGFKRGGAIAAL